MSEERSTFVRMRRLTDDDQQLLTFEHDWYRSAGAKEQAIRDRFGISATTYYARVNRLLDDPAALAAEPVLVNRLRRLREQRRRARSGSA